MEEHGVKKCSMQISDKKGEGGIIIILLHSFFIPHWCLLLITRMFGRGCCGAYKCGLKHEVKKK